MQRHKCGESAADQGALPFLWRWKKIRQPLFWVDVLGTRSPMENGSTAIMVLATACLATWKPHSMSRHRVATNCTGRGGMKNARAVIWAVALLCAASGACAQGYPASCDARSQIDPGLHESKPGEARRAVAESTSILLRAFFVPRATAKRTSATRARHSGSESMPFFYKPVIYLASPTGFEPVLPP